jgi:hypothetical protein
MGWETRRGRGRYYTRSHKIADRVVREYVGTGLVAELAAQQDAAARAARQAERDRFAQTIDHHRDADAAQAAFAQLVDGLTAAVLVAAGYHRHHRGEWRKRRVATP